MFDFVRKNDNVTEQIAELTNRVRELESEVESLQQRFRNSRSL